MKKKVSLKTSLSDQEEAEIQRMIAADPDSPELTDEQLAKGRPFAEVFPRLAASIKRSRGRPRLDDAKVAVTLRVHPDTLKRFQIRGDEWRGDMAKALDAASRGKTARR